MRQTGKPSRGNHHISQLWNHRLLQTSSLHTAFGGRNRSACVQLGRRHQGKLLWVTAVRHNSSQIPPDDGSVAPVLEAAAAPPPAAPIVTPQVPVDSISAADVPALDMASVLGQAAPDAPPTALDSIPTAVDVLQAVAAEPRLAELGLAANTPVGLIQNMLEFFHMDLGLPWWGAIVVGTVLARLAVFPVIVKGQREAAKLNNVLPQITKLTNRMNDAKQSGNKFEFAKAYSDLNLFQKKHDVNPLRGFLVPLVQAPVFISFFIALRKMAYLPVPSLQTGGALWFTDLSAADPFYILPFAVTGTMFFILEVSLRP
ncbi:unnamed protein product [Menidia menidia]|uniref:(Atlantic silverside) hypothetical protein n=1 Tax=Menidia menidia TaxID=238744 RepID=A0A8S4B4M3_9TELE|nr:unnamed protein product [Menidia menidia]